MNYKKFIHSDLSGNELAIVSVEKLPDGIAVIKYSKPEIHQTKEVWNKLFKDAFDEAKKMKPSTISCRLKTDYQLDLFTDILKGLGMAKHSERIEYKQKIDLLPAEDLNHSPLKWKSAKKLQWSEHRIAEFTALITGENSDDFVKDFLFHEELTSGLECIHIGFLAENPCEPCALVVAQIEKDTGWSRLSYMGLTEDCRNKKLGRWVHLHGFSMMKAQGGILYHGGTTIDNTPMKKLFAKHGCEEFLKLEEWQI